LGTPVVRGEFSFSGPWAILHRGPFWKAEEAIVTFSDSDPVPKFFNLDLGPGAKYFQI